MFTRIKNNKVHNIPYKNLVPSFPETCAVDKSTYN